MERDPDVPKTPEIPRPQGESGQSIRLDDFYARNPDLNPNLKPPPLSQRIRNFLASLIPRR